MTTQYFLVPAPGHYGDRARVISAHATLAAARKAKGQDMSVSIRRGSLRSGDEWLRAYEASHPAEESAACPVCGDDLPAASRDRRVTYSGQTVCGRASCEEAAEG